MKKHKELEQNQEEVVGETPASEAPVEQAEEKLPINNPIKEEPLNQKVVEHFDYDSEYLQDIEDKRVEFLKFYKHQNIIKWVVGMVGLAIVIFAWIGFPNFGKNEDGSQSGWVMPAMIVTVVIALVGIFLYSFLLKRTISKKMKVYFFNYYEQCKNYIFSQEGFENATILVPDKIDRIQFDENNLYANVAEIGSRGLTEFTYNGDLMMICDCAAQVKAQKRIMPVFVGKYLVAPAAYASSDPIIIYIKGDHRSLPPTNLEGIKAVFDDKDMIIYSNNKDWAKTVNAKVKKALSNIKPDKQLIDISISILNGKVYMCLVYDDPVMVLPLEHAFDPNPIMEVRKEMPLFAKLAEELSK